MLCKLHLKKAAKNKKSLTVISLDSLWNRILLPNNEFAASIARSSDGLKIKGMSQGSNAGGHVVLAQELLAILGQRRYKYQSTKSVCKN